MDKVEVVVIRMVERDSKCTMMSLVAAMPSWTRALPMVVMSVPALTKKSANG